MIFYSPESSKDGDGKKSSADGSGPFLTNMQEAFAEPGATEENPRPNSTQPSGVLIASGKPSGPKREPSCRKATGYSIF